jgi:ADP-ribose pyrophosphatase
MSKDSDALQPWKTLHSEMAYETPWFTIEKEDLETPKGARPTFYIHHANDSALCVCVTDERKVLIERQYRPAIKRVSVDYPGGSLEHSDTDAEAAMLRELKEETGYLATSSKKLAVIDKDPGFSATRLHIYVVHGAVPGKDSQEDSESIISEFIPAEEVLELITAGEMACAYCVSATLFAFKELGWLTVKI